MHLKLAGRQTGFASQSLPGSLHATLNPAWSTCMLVPVKSVQFQCNEPARDLHTSLHNLRG